MNDLIIEGVDTRSWFSSLGLAPETPAEIQHVVAVLFRSAVASTAHRAEIVKVVSPQKLPPGMFGLVLERSKLFIQVKGISTTRAAVYAFLATTIASQSIEIGAAVGLGSQLLEKVMRLSESELELVRKFQRLCAPSSIYKTGLRLGQILESYPPSEQEAARVLLASMKAKGVVEEGADLWRVVL